MMGIMPGRRRGYRSRPHTADVLLEAWGPDLPSCCEEAVAALVSIYLGRVGDPATGRRELRLPAATDESLLVDLLEEVIFTLDTADAVPFRAEVRSTPDGGLDANLLLADPEHLEETGAVPKAISRSGLVVTTQAKGVYCRFLVDV
jgi:SHS2 domain-containing protein